MRQDLTTSRTDRQNILNNHYAMAGIEKAIAIKAVTLEGRSWLQKERIAAFFEK